MVAHLIEFATNHYILVGIFVVLLALLIAYQMQGGGRSLSTGELTGLVNKDAGVVIDIRPAKDFAAGHIVGALNIPHDKLAARVAELEKHKAKTIILVDAMGQTAGTHARELVKAGFTAAKLSGGVSSWKADNLPLNKGVAFEEIKVDGKPQVRAAMAQKAGRTSVPQIWIGSTHVGGCDDLFALERAGKLDALLKA
eukprot:gene4644-4546_t